MWRERVNRATWPLLVTASEATEIYRQRKDQSMKSFPHIDHETHAKDERYGPVNVQSDCTSVRDELVRLRKIELGSRRARPKGNNYFGQVGQKFMGAFSIVFGQTTERLHQKRSHNCRKQSDLRRVVSTKSALTGEIYRRTKMSNVSRVPRQPSTLASIF